MHICPALSISTSLRALQELLHSYALLSLATLGDPDLDATLIELEWEWAKSGDGFGVWW
jgi:hypothetical protein